VNHLWDDTSPGAARRLWEQGYNRAIRIRIEPLKDFAFNLEQRIDGVIAHCCWLSRTSLLEGISSKTGAFMWAKVRLS
jgi:transposase